MRHFHRILNSYFLLLVIFLVKMSFQIRKSVFKGFVNIENNFSHKIITDLLVDLINLGSPAFLSSFSWFLDQRECNISMSFHVLLQHIQFIGRMVKFVWQTGHPTDIIFEKIQSFSDLSRRTLIDCV